MQITEQPQKTGISIMFSHNIPPARWQKEAVTEQPKCKSEHKNRICKDVSMCQTVSTISSSSHFPYKTHAKCDCALELTASNMMSVGTRGSCGNRKTTMPYISLKQKS